MEYGRKDMNGYDRTCLNNLHKYAPLDVLGRTVRRSIPSSHTPLLYFIFLATYIIYFLLQFIFQSQIICHKNQKKIIRNPLSGYLGLAPSKTPLQRSEEMPTHTTKRLTPTITIDKIQALHKFIELFSYQRLSKSIRDHVISTSVLETELT